MLRPTFPLLTTRLALRPFEDGDLEALLAMQGREDVTRYLDWPPFDRAWAETYLGRIKHYTGFDETHDGLRLAGVRRDSGQLVGDFSIWRARPDATEAEVGFVVHPDHQGRGYAREAMELLLALGFEELRLHRIIGRCDARNEASFRLMEQLGMRREAHFREAEFIKGEWVDELIYAILDREWAGRRR
jgi:RimJ/RimL family protein N-acetyltransferase